MLAALADAPTSYLIRESTLPPLCVQPTTPYPSNLVFASAYIRHRSISSIPSPRLQSVAVGAEGRQREINETIHRTSAVRRLQEVICSDDKAESMYLVLFRECTVLAFLGT